METKRKHVDPRLFFFSETGSVFGIWLHTGFL